MQLKSFIPSDTLLLRAEILQLTEENYDLKACFEAAVRIIMGYSEDSDRTPLNHEQAIILINMEVLGYRKFATEKEVKK